MAALSVMTCISVAIGLAFKSMPDALQSTIPLGQYLGAATMLYFGVKTLRVRGALSPLVRRADHVEHAVMRAAHVTQALADPNFGVKILRACVSFMKCCACV